jgi:hypothetical protein
LQVGRTLRTESPMGLDAIADMLAALDDQGRGSYVPDALKLPPGQVVDLAADAELGLIYVLGRGLPNPADLPPEPGDLFERDSLRRFYAPGWISLVAYRPDALADAAPRHGLGYYNLPQDLVPTAMALGDEHLYVSARGYRFPHIRTEHDDQAVLLVYDREDRDPFDPVDQPPGKDRDYLLCAAAADRQRHRPGSRSSMIWCCSPPVPTALW